MGFGEHTLPQPPQLLGSVCVFTHWPLQSVPAQVATQEPFWQLWPLVHAFPQLPQFCGSVWVFTQVLPHLV